MCLILTDYPWWLPQLTGSDYVMQFWGKNLNSPWLHHLPLLWYGLFLMATLCCNYSKKCISLSLTHGGAESHRTHSNSIHMNINTDHKDMMCAVTPPLVPHHQHAVWNVTRERLDAGAAWFSVKEQRQRDASIVAIFTESLCENGCCLRR